MVQNYEEVEVNHVVVFKKNDLTGQKYGMLTVLKRDMSRKSVYYLCRCECGNVKSVLSQHLKRGSIISCGCFHKSKGEERIKELLLNNNYKFQQEYSFVDLKFNSQKRVRFDFRVQTNNKFYLIEFDGKQHYFSYNSWGGEKELLIRQEHDNLKNQYCKNNNIPLIRIPYNKLKSLKITDLELKHSNYIVVRGWFDELP